MQATIYFILSATGRKNAVLAGRDGAANQTLAVESTDPLWPTLVALSEIAADGTVRVPRCKREWDSIPTATDLVAALQAEAAEQAAAEAAERAQVSTETAAVLADRRTKKRKVSVSLGEWIELQPDWPYRADSSITGSAEAVAWQAELDAANAAAKESGIAQRIAECEAEQAEREAEAAAKAARRAEMGLVDGDFAITVESGATLHCPAWESHSRGKNWMARIDIDPNSPGGLARRFCEKAKGDYFYILPDDLAVGDAIEYGADYYSGRGRKSEKRWHGFVRRIDRDGAGEIVLVVLAECGTGRQTIAAGKKHAAQQSAR